MKETPAVEVRQLEFAFSKEQPLFDQLDLSIPRGSTFGILGQNGVGKSTLIRILVGLIPAQTTRLALFGESLIHHRSSIMAKIGFLIEGPRLYPHLSGKDNLKVFATYRQIPFAHIAGVLREVGLDQQAQKRVRYYSTGMRQRLAIAVALLHDPQLLILDEPTNGLDPQGIVEVRQLIRKLKKHRQRTIIFCSHILNEVQQICDHFGVLHRGKFVFQGPLLKFQGASHTYRIETDDPKGAEKILVANNYLDLRREENDLVLDIEEGQQINKIIDLLRAASISIYQIKRIEQDLESTYLRLIQS